MGNSCGAMHKYTDLTDTGRAIRADLSGIDIDPVHHEKGQIRQVVQAYGGDFGGPTDGDFSGKRHLLRRRERGFSKDAGGEVQLSEYLG